MKVNPKARSMARNALCRGTGSILWARDMLKQIKHPTPREIAALKLVRRVLPLLNRGCKLVMDEVRSDDASVNGVD